MLDKTVKYCGVIMENDNTGCFPEYALPEGFAITGYREGLENDWAKLLYAVEQTSKLDEGMNIFTREFLVTPELLPERCLFVVDHNRNIAASASLWHGKYFGKSLPRLHWVTTSPEYQGRGLVKALLTEIFRLHNRLTPGKIMFLTSSTWSYKAINIYLKFGFKPYMGPKPPEWSDDNFDENNKIAWDIIIEKINSYSLSDGS